MKPMKIKVDIYSYEVIIVGTREAFNAAVKRRGFEPADTGDAAGVCYSFSHVSFIGIFDREIDTLVHELTHATLFILKSRSIDPLSSNGEPAAYLMEYLFNRATRALRS